MVLDVLRRLGSANAAVAKQGLLAIVELVYGDSDYSRRLGEAGAATGS